jgi:hypothetical protein
MFSLLVGASFELFGEWLTPPNEHDWLSEGAFLAIVVTMALIAACGVFSTLRAPNGTLS